MTTLHDARTTSSPSVPRVPCGTSSNAGRRAPAPEPRRPEPMPGAGSDPAREFLSRYTRTLTALLVSIAALLLLWNKASAATWTSGHPWPTAIAATGIWAFAVAAWLHRRRWRAGTVHAVSWGVPTVLLLPLIGCGWLSPAGLVLWGPVSAFFAVALVMTADPMDDCGTSWVSGRSAATDHPA